MLVKLFLRTIVSPGDLCKTWLNIVCIGLYFIPVEIFFMMYEVRRNSLFYSGGFLFFVLFRRPPLLDTKWNVIVASQTLASFLKIPLEIFFLFCDREKN